MIRGYGFQLVGEYRSISSKENKRILGYRIECLAKCAGFTNSDEEIVPDFIKDSWMNTNK